MKFSKKLLINKSETILIDVSKNAKINILDSKIIINLFKPLPAQTYNSTNRYSIDSGTTTTHYITLTFYDSASMSINLFNNGHVEVTEYPTMLTI